MAIDGVGLLPWRLGFDTGALVLIWLVQLVIYPVFSELAAADFQRWHPVYTQRVTLVVMPVMLGQVAVYALSFYYQPTWDLWLGAGLIAAVWGVTFFQAVPLHGSLDGGGDHLPATASLIAVNWWRTGIWSVVWGLGVWRWWVETSV